MSKYDRKHNVTARQEWFLRELRRTIPGVEVTDAEMFLDGAVWITFERVDPRPSRNGLVDHGCRGYVMIGKQGGVRDFRLSDDHAFGDTRETGGKRNATRDWWHAARCAGRHWQVDPHSSARWLQARQARRAALLSHAAV